jgi:hypothetical protein
MEDKESLKTCALISQFADTIKYYINNFLSNGVVATSIVICSIFLASNQLLRVEKLAVCSSTNLICKIIFLSYEL